MKPSSPLGPPPRGWVLARLGDLAVKIGSGATPKGGESVYLPARIRFALIRSQNVFDRHFAEAGLAFITDVHARGLSSATVEPGDVLLNITGDGVTFGRACLAPPHAFPACVNQHVSIIRLDRSLCLPEYLLCFLTHPAVKRYIESFNAGGSRRAITKGHVESFVVPLPPLREQERIGTALGTLDQKMECNRRMNETLEAMARAIFKSWFVDFDPVRAKAEGRQSDLEPNLDALFPDWFRQCESGPLPNGWTMGTLGTIATAVRRPANPRDVHADTPYVGLEHMPRRSIALGEWGRAGEVTSGKNRFHLNDILFGKLRPYFHKVGLAPVDGVCSTDILTVAPVSKRWLSFALFHLSSTELVNYADSCSTGTKMPRVNWNDLARYEVVFPPERVAGALQELTSPMLNSILCNLRQSRALAALRDALLPKLLSGQIRVREAEKIIGARA